jgi:hypothetical protein
MTPPLVPAIIATIDPFTFSGFVVRKWYRVHHWTGFVVISVSDVFWKNNHSFACGFDSSF